MAQQVIGLDIDQERVSGVVLEASARGVDWHVVKIFERDLPDAKDEEGNPRTLVQRQKPALMQSPKSQKRRTPRWSPLFQHSKQVYNLAFPFNDQRKIAAVMPGMLETEIPFDVDDLAVSWRIHNANKKLAPGRSQRHGRLCEARKSRSAS